jgi:hypothetical protein
MFLISLKVDKPKKVNDKVHNYWIKEGLNIKLNYNLFHDYLKNRLNHNEYIYCIQFNRCRLNKTIYLISFISNCTGFDFLSSIDNINSFSKNYVYDVFQRLIPNKEINDKIQLPIFKIDSIPLKSKFTITQYIILNKCFKIHIDCDIIKYNKEGKSSSFLFDIEFPSLIINNNIYFSEVGNYNYNKTGLRSKCEISLYNLTRNKMTLLFNISKYVKKNYSMIKQFEILYKNSNINNNNLNINISISECNKPNKIITYLSDSINVNTLRIESDYKNTIGLIGYPNSNKISFINNMINLYKEDVPSYTSTNIHKYKFYNGNKSSLVLNCPDYKFDINNVRHIKLLDMILNGISLSTAFDKDKLPNVDLIKPEYKLNHLLICISIDDIINYKSEVSIDNCIDIIKLYNHCFENTKDNLTKIFIIITNIENYKDKMDDMMYDISYHFTNNNIKNVFFSYNNNKVLNQLILSILT